MHVKGVAHSDEPIKLFPALQFDSALYTFVASFSTIFLTVQHLWCVSSLSQLPSRSFPAAAGSSFQRTGAGAELLVYSGFFKQETDAVSDQLVNTGDAAQDTDEMDISSKNKVQLNSEYELID